MKRILVMILSIVTFVLHSLVIVGLNLIVPILLAYGIKDVDIVLAGLTILLTFIVMYVCNKYIWNIIKDSFHEFMKTIFEKKKCI